MEDRVPDARTIWLFREKLTTAGAIKRLFEQFDAMLRQAGCIAMSGQIVDASLVAAPRQRNTDDEKKAIKEAVCRRIGRPSQPSCGTRIAMRARPSNSPRPNRAWMAQCRQSIWQSRYLAVRTMSRSIYVSATDAAAYEGRRLRQGFIRRWAACARSPSHDRFASKWATDCV